MQLSSEIHLVSLSDIITAPGALSLWPIKRQRTKQHIVHCPHGHIDYQLVEIINHMDLHLAALFTVGF